MVPPAFGASDAGADLVAYWVCELLMAPLPSKYRPPPPPVLSPPNCATGLSPLPISPLTAPLMPTSIVPDGMLRKGVVRIIRLSCPASRSSALVVAPANGGGVSLNAQELSAGF